MNSNSYRKSNLRFIHICVYIGSFLLLACTEGNSILPLKGTAIDQTPPTITIPQNITISVFGASEVPKKNTTITAFLNMASAVDDVDGIIAVSNNAPAIFPIGQNTVVFTATDASGNSATATALVTVASAMQGSIGTNIDQTPPTILLPQNITVSVFGTSGVPKTNSAIVAFLNMASAIDDVDGIIKVYNDAPSVFPIGQSTVVFKATDTAGNSTLATALVTVVNVLPQGNVVYSGTVVDSLGNPVAGATPIVKTSNGVLWEGGISDSSGNFSMVFNPTLYPNETYFIVGAHDIPTQKLQAAWYNSITGSTSTVQNATQIPIQNLSTSISAHLVLQPGALIQVSTNTTVTTGAAIKIFNRFNHYKKTVRSAGTYVTEFVVPTGSYTVTYEPSWLASRQADTVYWGGTGQTFDPTLAQPVASNMTQTQSILFADQLMTSLNADTIATHRINGYRQLLGLPLLTGNTELAQTARNHSSYLLLNQNHPSTLGLGAHTETVGLPGFTGVSAQDRYVHVSGVTPTLWWVGELFYTSSNIIQACDWFINSVYHQIPLLNSHTASIGTGRADGGWTIINVGTTISTTPHPLYVYPANNQFEVPLAFYNREMPDPLLGSGLTVPTGPIISMNAPGHYLVVSTATLTETKSGTAVPLFILDAANDPNARLNMENVFFFPHQVLKPQTNYTVNAVYTMDGISGNRTWVFTTAWE